MSHMVELMVISLLVISCASCPITLSLPCILSSLFFFNDTATTEIYTYGHTLSLHDALPICVRRIAATVRRPRAALPLPLPRFRPARREPACKSEEHTSELQSLMRISYAVFCLKKKTNQHTEKAITTLN